VKVRERWCTVAALALAAGLHASAPAPVSAQIRVRSSVDTTLVTVGDRITLTVQVEHPEDATVLWPDSLDLSPFGYGGCFLYQSLNGQVTSFTDGTGSAAVAIPVPNDQNLVNLPVHLQWLVVDLFSGGIALSPLGTVIIEQ